MNNIILGVLFLGLLLAALCYGGANIVRDLRRAALVVAVNTLPPTVGSSERSRRYLASGAIGSGATGTAYYLGKIGADSRHATLIAAAADEPLGAFTDEAAAAEDLINLELAGLTERTLPLVADGVIALGADVYSKGDGKVTVKPTAAGTYWKVGKALTASTADNDPIEVRMQVPRKLIVLAALTNVAGDIADTPSTAVNPTKADFDSLLVAAGKLQADFLLLVAALKTGADIDYAA
ncbi:MAG TPA: capsid cement protein [Rariglobus sp.]|nr:capsid cement protein [Rariglobus sp.]